MKWYVTLCHQIQNLGDFSSNGWNSGGGNDWNGRVPLPESALREQAIEHSLWQSVLKQQKVF